MYSRSYIDDHNANDIPVESFTAPISKEDFKRSFEFQNNERNRPLPEKQIREEIREETEEYEEDDEDFHEKNQIHKQEEIQVKKTVKKEENKGVFSFLDGFLKNIQLEDIILGALIIIFLKDNNKDNDIMIPVLLFILLAF